MFEIKEDMSIHITRGDVAYLSIAATDDEGAPFLFREGDKIRFSVMERKACDRVVLKKDVVVPSDLETLEIFLSEQETRIGKPISKPVEYWYEVEYINKNLGPQTIVGYDEDGPKIFRLYPESVED